MSKKYQLTNEIKQFKNKVTNKVTILYRIRALRNFDDVKAGDLGGFIEKEINLSHEGNCWVYDDAWVYGHARVSENAKIRHQSQVCGQVYGNAQICDQAFISQYAKIYDNARVSKNAYAYGSVYGKAQVSHTVKVWGRVCGRAKLNRQSKIREVPQNKEVSKSDILMEIIEKIETKE
ncbi:hypothetical protein NPX99_07015 [Bartonella sp. 220]|uniref:hypothetical protein n=1 Tax=Bartonella sp. 220B TaxID=2967260 RepID=UPI0022A992E4|nr:hypothetical protein [Bartonella sp. 220B]MCZ2159010.1 hypothetical protein [Bartonella sp. 220B]